MSAPGVQRHPHQRGVVVLPQHPIGQSRFPHTLAGALDGKDLTLAAVLEEKIGHFPLFFGRRTRNTGKILLFQLLFLYRTGKPCGSLTVSGENHQPCSAPIQPMDGKHLSAALGSEGGQQAVLTLTLGQQPGRLDTDDDIVVLIKNLNHKHSRISNGTFAR